MKQEFRIENLELRISIFFASVFLLLLAICVTPSAQAQVAPLQGSDCQKLGINCSPGDNAGTVRTYALSVINVILGIVGVIALIMVIVAGIRYITGRGDEGETEKAKKSILYAVIGIVVIGLAAIIVNFTMNAAGVQGNVPGGSNLVGAALTILNVFLTLVGVTALIYVLVGGIRYITALGDESKVEGAKKTILYAVIGTVVVGIAAVVVNFTALSVGLPTGLPGGSNLPGAALKIINVFLALVGVTALVFVLIGGVRYITSLGDEGKLEEAKKTILYAVIGLVVVGIAGVVVNFAAAAVGLSTGIPVSNNLPLAILTVINYALVLAGLTALIFIILGGVRYITSQGDEEHAAEGKKTILYAVIGLIVIGLAAVTVNFVISAFI